jgi:hypothetical protein
MIRAALLALAFLSPTKACGEERNALVTRLVRFAYDGCEFLHEGIGNGGSVPHRSDKLEAAHFGKTIRVTPRQGADLYELEVPQFRSWRATFRGSELELVLPRNVRLTVADFERVLGPATEPDEDYALGNGTGEVADVEELVFTAPKGQSHCRVRITVATGKERARERVLRFAFLD